MLTRASQWLLLAVAFAALALGLPQPASAQQEQAKKTYPERPEMTIDTAATYVATVETNKGTFKAELYPAEAPVTVNSFVFLANEGFYNGLIFHRVIPGFVIQGGDPQGTGNGGPGYKLPSEVKDNDLRHVKGALAMADAGLNTAGSQFYVALQDLPQLDNRYTVFGKVVEGMDVVENIGSVPTAGRDRPVEPVVIQTITISKKEAQ
ncbi:MAG: peptidylprolyl isomerase [Phycisphaerae bacterium]